MKDKIQIRMEAYDHEALDQSSLEIVDTAWKDHLLVMDHLRSSVGLKGYAQMDPKVEYKREGMSLFETMWKSIGERVTDLIFRMDQLDEEFVGSTWVETAARHDEAASAGDMTLRPAPSAFGALSEPGRSPMTTSPTPLSRKLLAWAWP